MKNESGYPLSNGRILEREGLMTKTISFTIAIFVLVTCIASAGIASKIKPWVDANTANGRTAEFFIVMKEKADLSPAFKMATKVERGKFVFKTMYETAQRSQAPLQQLLKSRGIEFRSFFIVNSILVKGGRPLVDEMAARDDVASIDGNPIIHNNLPKPESSIRTKTPATIEWNIDKTNAPDLWALGFFGQGIVVGGADTGYRWTHDALKGKYRGWDGTNADHDYNWHDAIHSGGGICGADSPEPCDDFFHGTHTMGTVVGDDGAGNQIGMAPGAKWIGCRNMDQGNGTPATYLECFEFFMAPYPVGSDPSQGDPTLAPDLTTNSWSCTTGEGCTIGDELQAAVDAQKAAGIMTVSAAQNQGPSCGTVDFPPGIYASSYTVGSTTSSDQLSGFSSRGPADFTGLMKPSIVAPGSGVRSATNTCDSCYTQASGTSMATPNVAGGVALIWSALPSYQNNQDSTETLLNDSAKPLPAIVESCGGDYVDGPNNSWGYGLMDVLSAYNCGTTPPAIPQNLTSMVTANNEVSLSWDAVTGATSYEIYRSDGSCPGSTFAQIGTSTVPNFLDTTVAPNSTYSYVVKALVDFCESAFSNCTDETIPGACTYCDDFEDGVLDPNWTYVKPTWSETGGNLVGTPVKKKAIAVASPVFVGCLNCSVQAKMLTNGGVGNKVWLLAWYVDKANTIELMMKQETGRWVIKQRVAKQVVAKQKAISAISVGVVYTVVITFNGTQFDVSVDGTSLMTLTPVGAVPTGTVGFQVKNTTGQFGEIVVN